MAKPAEDPRVAEPAQPTLASKQTEVPEDPPLNAQPEMPELFVDGTTIDPSSIEPSSLNNPSEIHADDVVITGTGFTKPGNPTILAKHSAKQEVMER